MAGAMTAWLAETWSHRSTHRQESGIGSQQPAESGQYATAGIVLPYHWLTALTDLVTPLTVACAVLAVLPDFDVFLHTHRTYSHSLGAAAIVWGLVALVAWRLRLPVVETATICAAAYASHVLLDWLGRDDSRLPGPMALWPLTVAHFKSGADLFMEFTLLRRRRFDVAVILARNALALAREVALMGPPFVLVMMLRVKAGRRKDEGGSWREARPEHQGPGLSGAPVVPEEPG